jgi:hypothetical protein
MELPEWLEEHTEGWLWYVKRLSGNDTLANGSHQAGFYMPKPVFFRLFPSLEHQIQGNADKWFPLTIDSHPDAREVRAVWYNNRLRGGTRDEVRVTNLGGGASALLDPESTGALTIFAFCRGDGADAESCRVWVCRNEVEEELVEREIGPVEPGRWTTFPADGWLLAAIRSAVRADCRLAAHQLPRAWLKHFPSGEEIVRKVMELRPDRDLWVDDRILRRRDCEFELFQSLEEAVELPRAQAGFPTIAEFLAAAQTVLQRRKSRAGRSLELHMRAILLEERFVEGRDFSYQPKAGNNPDFLFPNEQAYLNVGVPRERIRMLAVKTTFRDRWRQVAEECADLPVRHLLTVQEGVSETQFNLISKAGIRLVVPKKTISSYSPKIRGEILTLEGFLQELRAS